MPTMSRLIVHDTDTLLSVVILAPSRREHKYHITHDVLRGMVYLHSIQPPLIHRDIKPAGLAPQQS